MGLAGGLMMLALLMYPVRKHVRRMQGFGPLKYWFRAHMMGGVLGPVLVLLHSTLQLGSLNATVAFFCMLLVMTSGLVGRFVYRRIHHGLYGRRASMQELTSELAQHFDALAPAMARMPEVQARIEAFADDAKAGRPALWQRVLHFAGMGWRRRAVARRTRTEIDVRLRAATSDADRQRLLALACSVNNTLDAIQATAQFKTYERLFALWHVAHIPFLYMLAFTAAFHVLAVHLY
jgi:hypothetical protein